MKLGYAIQDAVPRSHITKISGNQTPLSLLYAVVMNHTVEVSDHPISGYHC